MTDATILLGGLEERLYERRGAVIRTFEGGEGPPLLLVHGLGGAAWNFSELAPLLPGVVSADRANLFCLPIDRSRSNRYVGLLKLSRKEGTISTQRPIVEALEPICLFDVEPFDPVFAGNGHSIADFGAPGACFISKLIVDFTGCAMISPVLQLRSISQAARANGPAANSTFSRSATARARFSA